LFDLKKNLQLTVQVCCLFYFSIYNRFFHRKVEWVLLLWAFEKKQPGGIFGFGFNYINPGSNGKIYPPNTQAYLFTFHTSENLLVESSFF